MTAFHRVLCMYDMYVFTWCVCVCHSMCVSIRRQPEVLTFYFGWDGVSYTRLAGPGASGESPICIPSPSRDAGIADACHDCTWLLRGSWGESTLRSSGLHWKPFTYWAILSPGYIYVDESLFFQPNPQSNHCLPSELRFLEFRSLSKWHHFFILHLKYIYTRFLLHWRRTSLTWTLF